MTAVYAVTLYFLLTALVARFIKNDWAFVVLLLPVIVVFAVSVIGLVGLAHVWMRLANMDPDEPFAEVRKRINVFRPRNVPLTERDF